MIENPKISVVLAVYNGENTIQESINSVLEQSYTNLELIVVNDGSTDKTLDVIHNFSDPRIILVTQENKGVSAARNIGLSKISGDFFCFIDADDCMPRNSIRARLDVFLKDEELVFVDGEVEERELATGNIIRTYVPSFKGNPLKELMMLNDSCFCGQTWMVRNVFREGMPSFDSELTHGEDITFFIDCVSWSQGKYSFTDELILVYNRHSGSAMGNIDGLKRFYKYHLSRVQDSNEVAGLAKDQVKELRRKIRSILMKSYLKQGKFLDAIKTIFEF